MCRFEFNNIDLNVVLHQLGYTGGGVCMYLNYSYFLSPIKISSAFSSHVVDSIRPALMTRVACIGVERRLIDCPIRSALNNYMCNPVEISVNNGSNH